MKLCMSGALHKVFQKNTKIVIKITLNFWWRHRISRRSVKISILWINEIFHISWNKFAIPLSIWNMLLEKSIKVSLNLLDWNTTNIVKDILIFPTEDIQKNEHLIVKKCWHCTAKSSSNFEKKNSEYKFQIDFRKSHQI